MVAAGERRSPSSTRPSSPLASPRTSTSCGTAGTVEETGRVDPSAVDAGGVEVRAWFTPTYGEDLSHRIANAIGRARRRVRICSPVLTAAPVISTLAQRVSEGNARRRRLHRRDADQRRLPRLAPRRKRGLEDPDPGTGARGALLRQAVGAIRRRGASTTSCTRRSRWPTTSSSPAASTSRAAARRTRRTCSRSTTPRSPSGSRTSSIRFARVTPASSTGEPRVPP